MEDKAGTVITVGCRVAEADFSFSDGTVESITVPVTGGGYHVGVHWDEPDKGRTRVVGRGRRAQRGAFVGDRGGPNRAAAA